MSVRFDPADYMTASTNLPGSPSGGALGAYTHFGWCKFINTTAAARNLFTYYDGSSGQHHYLRRDGDGNVRGSGNSGLATIVPTQVTVTTWFAFAFVYNGSSSATVYLRQDGAGSWNSASNTAEDFTPLGTIAWQLGSSAGVTADAEFRYYRTWNAALTEEELSDEFGSATVVRTADLLRNLPLAAASSANDDISSNNYDMTVSGTLADGASEPTSPTSVVKKLKLLAHSSAASAAGVAGVVFAAPTGGAITGAEIGEFTGATFEASLESGKAVLKVACSEFGGTSLTTSDTPVALVRNSSNTTGIVSCTVIEE